MNAILRTILVGAIVSLGPGVAMAQDAPQADVGNAPGLGAYAEDVAAMGCGAGCADSCCFPAWAHRTGLFGEFIYLRPRDVEVAYGVPIDGTIAPPEIPPVQIGPIGVADPDHEPGFRVGGVWALESQASVVATFTALESQTTDSMAVTAPTAIRSLLLHPTTANATDNFLDANVDYNVDFDTVDIDYRQTLACGERYIVNYAIGTRYARIDQDLISTFTSATVTESVVTDVNFDGGGPRIGLDYERHGCNSGFMSYGRAAASFVAGEFGATYRQGSTVDPVIVDTAWEADRLVSILDLEFGGGWQSRNGRWRFNVGYLISGWFNTVQTDEWIDAVQDNEFVGLNDRMTFDGYTFRVELRY